MKINNRTILLLGTGAAMVVGSAPKLMADWWACFSSCQSVQTHCHNTAENDYISDYGNCEQQHPGDDATIASCQQSAEWNLEDKLEDCDDDFEFCVDDCC